MIAIRIFLTSMPKAKYHVNMKGQYVKMKIRELKAAIGMKAIAEYCRCDLSLVYKWLHGKRAGGLRYEMICKLHDETFPKDTDA